MQQKRLGLPFYSNSAVRVIGAVHGSSETSQTKTQPRKKDKGKIFLLLMSLTGSLEKNNIFTLLPFLLDGKQHMVS